MNLASQELGKVACDDEITSDTNTTMQLIQTLSRNVLIKKILWVCLF